METNVTFGTVDTDSKKIVKTKSGKEVFEKDVKFGVLYNTNPRLIEPHSEISIKLISYLEEEIGELYQYLEPSDNNDKFKKLLAIDEPNGLNLSTKLINSILVEDISQIGDGLKYSTTWKNLLPFLTTDYIVNNWYFQNKLHEKYVNTLGIVLAENSYIVWNNEELSKLNEVEIKELETLSEVIYL